MKNLFLFVFALFSTNLFAQDIIPTNKGDIKIHPIVHGTLAMEYEGLTIYVDPYGGADGFQNLNDADLILITDIHGDHLNQETLQALNTSNSHFIVPEAVAKKMEEIENSAIEILNNNKSTSFKGIEISALPMYNLPESEDSRHTKGRGNGYLLKIADKLIYISGDTEDIPEMRALQNVDVAFICMNLPYTMSIEQASDAVLEFKPTIVYPFHFRGQGGLADVEQFKSLVNEKNSGIEVRLRNWYPAK
ncbi:metal-dependent hydrolase [Marivirga tractuosa]|uniref:Metallo-hydrolase/oxidoreductase n=1 Tax=Marivirga tractuosa (strain ATCC 23168 / DSM 4126 / NBRC 15989 / NCIMB 1408 / VKM B-1430 / H-43) TaxID=643867 RepID=E4TL66_MARTH|nr:MBL fold metallo-hydrolase [Marivirga tractuosa]ADR20204.1 putative metallo-hydrolase/oxidoreductase [Marivirga tractuosa DSM 4126]BDD15355.1 metal-dependent hydrolase [Marivirga tractuosa]